MPFRKLANGIRSKFCYRVGGTTCVRVSGRAALAFCVLMHSAIVLAGKYEYECRTIDWKEVDESGQLAKPSVAPDSLGMLKAFPGKSFFIDRQNGTVLGGYPFWLPPSPETRVLSAGSETQSFSVIYVGPAFEGGRRVVFLTIYESHRKAEKPFVASDATSVYTGSCK